MTRFGIIVSSSLLMACTNTVFDEAGITGDGGNGAGGQEQGGDGQGNGGTSKSHMRGDGGCGSDCQPTNAIVYQSGETQPGAGGGGSVTVTTTGGGPSPETVHLQLSDYGESCSLSDELLPCGGYTRYTVTLPKSMLVPGIVYLSHPDVWLTIEETTPEMDGECGFGFGGGFEEGHLEIYGVDGQILSGALVGITTFGSYDPNGEIVADLCGL